MPSSTVTVQVENLKKLIDNVKAVEAAGKKAVSSTLKDVKSRAPGWIASEVVAVYNIKKSEIVPAGKGAKPRKMAGTLRIQGETIEELAFIYEGRRLTPVHFGMTPKAPPNGKNYTLKMQVVKGKKTTIGRYKAKRTPGGPFSQRSHNILMGTGNMKEGGVNWIPFQRMSKTRLDLKKFLTTSVPQMVTSDLTYENIMAKLNEETAKRLEHNLNRFMK